MKTTLLALGALSLVAAFAVQHRDEPLAIEKEDLPPPNPTPGEDGCPDGQDSGGLGPEMRRLPEGFCIDKTEVTQSQYNAWLDSNPATTAQSAECSSNDDFTPACRWPPTGNNEGQPVTCVDWCDAQAFCEAAGKRLCGAIGTGEAYPFEDYDDPTISEWQAACSSGGEHDFTYGDTFNTDRCRDADADDYTTWGLADAGSFDKCQSPDAAYNGVFDLSGHVAEWDNSCSSDGCRIRGGSYEHHSYGTRCTMGKTLSWPRERRTGSVGFRCCAN